MYSVKYQLFPNQIFSKWSSVRYQSHCVAPIRAKKTFRFRALSRDYSSKPNPHASSLGQGLRGEDNQAKKKKGGD